MDMSSHEVAYLAQSHWHHFRYRVGEMVGLDRERREVLVASYIDDEGQEVTPQRVFAYDTLVIAVGSQSNDFGTPGVREHAMRLESAADALRFRSRMVNACIRGHAQSTALRPEQLQVAIIGAGATGQYEASLANVDRAIVLNPMTPPIYLVQRARALYGLDRFDDASKASRAALLPAPGNRSAVLIGAAADVARGAIEQAKASIADWLQLNPDFTLSSPFFAVFFARDAMRRQELLERLRLAGVPDSS